MSRCLAGPGEELHPAVVVGYRGLLEKKYPAGVAPGEHHEALVEKLLLARGRIFAYVVHLVPSCGRAGAFCSAAMEVLAQADHRQQRALSWLMRNAAGRRSLAALAAVG